MKNRYTHWRSLTILILMMIGVSSCTDELAGLEINSTRPSDVICFTASLFDTCSASQTRSASGHLEIEQEDWLVGTEQSVTRGTPVTLLEGSAGVIGYVYNTWQEYSPAEGETSAIIGTLPWETLYNKEFKFDGDELTAASNNVRWATLKQSNVRFYAYAPYNLTGGTLSSEEQGGSPKITYIVSDTPSEQHDLIVASWEGLSSYRQSIPLVFNHALTAVRFKIGFGCKVIKLEVKGIYNSGTYTLGDGWEVNTTSNDVIYKFTFGDKIPNTEDDYTGKDFNANAFLIDGDNTLMMIPQTLSSSAQVKLTYIEGGETKYIISTLSGKVWQEGKMITYTIHKDEAPTTIYFDLAAGNVTLGPTYSGKVYVNGIAQDVTGDHDTTNVYYVYQSSTSTESYNANYTGYANEQDYNSQSNCRIPDYEAVECRGKLWSEFITNNNNVESVIDAWYKDMANTATENRADLKGRTGTENRITVSPIENTSFDLVIDNIYSTYQVTSNSRITGGITFIPDGIKNCVLTINLLGDNRLGNIHYNNEPINHKKPHTFLTGDYGIEKIEEFIETYNQSNGSQIIFEGTGSLTVADVDGVKRASSDGKYNGENYYSNHYNAVIGGCDSDSGENSMGIVINSGVLFAGSTAAENCSAIGGGGNGIGEVTINGGTVTAVASTTGTAIGGGIGFSSNGGEGRVYINGGNVYAYNLDNHRDIPSSAIGGAGSNNSTGTLGLVEINGGYVYAYSHLGTAIGGGSSAIKVGGDAKVTLKGGQVIAVSGTGAGIGGGSASTAGGNTSNNGGTAIIDISGNPIVRTGSIGGGNTGDKGSIGSANIEISGGDIQAQFVMAAGAKAIPSFTMSGGTIRNSYVDDEEYIHIKKQGGAVYLEDGTFTMSGGTIKNCSAEQGGAVYVNSQSGNSTFTMTGGEIHSCFATGTYNNASLLTASGHGGAVCLVGGNVNMSGGKIRNNYSENGDGGAVYISNGNFSMSNNSTTISENYPTITENAAHKGNGGGVFVSSEKGKSVMVNLLQGIITNNTANNYGGGICVDMGNTENAATVTVGDDGQGATESDANPMISGNMAMMSGGGLYVRGTNANVTINSGMIDDNKVSAYVKNEDVTNEMGGVTLNAGLVTHVVVTFDGNKGTVDGTDTYYTQNIVTNTNSKLAPNLFERAGYRFNGWNTRADGLGETYYNKDPRPHSSNITLYAQWVAQ